MEEDLKKIFKILKDDRKKIKNIRQPPKNKKMEDDLKNNKKGRRPQKKMEDDLKKNLYLIPLKLRDKPFLGLAQLSKILFQFVM